MSLTDATKQKIKIALANSDAGVEVADAIDAGSAESGAAARLDAMAAVSAVASPDATDLASAQTLANELKAQVNALIAAAA